MIADNQAAVSIVEIRVPAVAGADIELIDQDVAQLQSMPLQARRVTIRFEAAAVILLSTNLRVRTLTSGVPQEIRVHPAARQREGEFRLPGDVEMLQADAVRARRLLWDFWHFGEFSRACKDCFGELPSDTLRRKRNEEVQ